MVLLQQQIQFPPVSWADEDGLLAVGGDLSPERLLAAYPLGIFPWYGENSPILWWSPNPRCVLFPEKLQVSKSMQQIIKQEKFEWRTNTAFEQVIQHCAATPRKDQEGTWITAEIKTAYTRLHQLGHAHSAEAWLNGILVGGLYGILIGKVFFGESMFSHQSNASKFAFIKWVRHLQAKGIQLIDCQMETPHLKSLGAITLPREKFIKKLQELCS